MSVSFGLISPAVAPTLLATTRVPLSGMSLGRWAADLRKRLHFFEAWHRGGEPPAFWLAAFILPQAFLTGMSRRLILTQAFLPKQCTHASAVRGVIACH